VVGGRSDEWVCANHPDHAGQLVVVASGEGVVDEAGPRCRSFRVRREPDQVAPAGVDDSVRYIPLTGGLFAIVDAADYEWLNKHNWRAFGTSAGYYAYREVKGRAVFMHRLIMNAPRGMVVDHINANKHDNRRCNLRLCTQAENVRNKRKSHGTSRFKGVWWHRARRKWIAVICHKGKNTILGRFDDEVEAAKAYDRAARERFGAFAYLNFPQSGNIVRLSGCICARSHTRGRIHRLKLRIQNLKSKTNSNIKDQRSKLQTKNQKGHCQRRFRSFDLCILTSDIVWDFEFRPSVPTWSRGPPERVANHVLTSLG
jgi:hypothetical protein